MRHPNITGINNPATATIAILVLAGNISIPLPGGADLNGRLEYFIGAKSLVLFDDDALEPVLLTINAAEAPEAHAALEADQVLLRNWTSMRGVPEILVNSKLVELTGEEVRIGTFQLQALVARVL
jgi:hypothetical protein